jgi:hypothetical protein
MLPKRPLIDMLLSVLLLSLLARALSGSLGRNEEWGQALPTLGMLVGGAAVTTFFTLGGVPLWKQLRLQLEGAMTVGQLTRIEIRGLTYILHYAFAAPDGTRRAGSMELLRLGRQPLRFLEGQCVPVAYARADPGQHTLDV